MQESKKLYFCIRILSQKYDKFVTNDKRKMKEKVQENLEKRIKKGGRGKLYINADFADLGSPAAVRQALQRLQKEETIVRVFRGIYSYPKIDTELGLGVLRPSIWEIAQAMARRDQTIIIPTAAEAMNLLGLSTQVVANLVFFTNGSSRKVKIGAGHGITFIHTSNNRMLSYRSQLMMLVVLAMREIGEEQLTDEQWTLIKSHLEHVKKTDFIHDIKLCPVWIQEKLNAL